MKTLIKNGHGEPSTGANLSDESSFGNGTIHELPVRGTKAKTNSILRAAAQVFAEQGYQAATMDTIAENAGVAKGTVYLYFPSKHELFFRVCDGYIAAIERIWTPAFEPTSPTAASQIQQNVHALLALTTETRDLLPLILEFWSTSASPHRHSRVAASFRRAYAKFRRLIADQIRKGQQNGEFERRADASQVAAMLLGALDGTLLQALFDPGLDPVSTGDRLATILLQSLASPEKAEGKLQPEDSVE